MRISRRDFIKCMAACGAGAGISGFISSCSRVRAEKDDKPAVKEAWFYEKMGGDQVQCRLCPWQCRIPDGGRGGCGARENQNGKLISLVYGKPVSLHVDPVEKKPFYHFLPGRKAFSLATVGCNFHCLFCQNWEISQARPEDVPFYYAPPDVLVDEAVKSSAPVIAYTYTEPIIFYEYMYNCSAAGKEKGLRSVMISAGYINEEPLKKLCGVLEGIKIDLKAFNENFYKNLVSGRLDPVLDTLVTIKKSGVWLEIVNLVIPGKNDDMNEIKKMALWIKENLGDSVPLHFTRFIPMYKLVNLPPTPVKTLERCRKAAMAQGLKYVYVGNVPGHPGNNTYCPGCGQIVIKREGFTAEVVGLENGACKKCGVRIAGVWK